jgi:MFS family permease
MAIGAAVIVMAVGNWSLFPLAQAFLMDIFSEETMGGDLGACRAIWNVVASLGPAYVGFVSGLWSYTAAFTGLIGCLVLSVVTMSILQLRTVKLSTRVDG